MSVDTSILVAARSVDITPQEPTALFGYIGRTSHFTKIDGKLEANILLTEQDGIVIAILSIDTLFVGDLESDLKDHLGSAAPNIKIIAVASHSHYAPCIDGSKPNIGQIDQRYYQSVLEKVSKALLELLNETKDTCSFQQTSNQNNDLAIHRRAKRFGFSKKFPFFRKFLAIAPNPKDNDIFPARFIQFQRNEETIAILWTWKCHPVSAVDPLSVSPSYIGAVREELRKRLNSPDLPVIFLQGFSGDIRPKLGLTSPTLRARLSSFPGPVFSTPNDQEYSFWLEQVAELAHSTVSKGGQKENFSGPISYAEASVPLKDIMDGEQSEKVISLSRLQFGKVANFIFVSAEVVKDYEALVKRKMPDHTYCIGYRGNCFGYLPTDAQVLEGGYEAEGFIEPFSLSGKFKAGLESAFCGALSELMKN